MALKTYTKADDVPEGLRGDYKQSGSVWVPDLSDDHPVLALNKTLKQEKEVEEAKVKKLRADLDDALEAAKTSGVPRGQALVAKADAELLNEVKALGAVTDIKTKLAEHETLKADATKRQREDKLVLVAKELGFSNADMFKLLNNLPDFDIRDGKDGKKTVIALVKDGDKTIEKPALEFLESSADHAPFLPALKSKPTGITVNATSGTTEPRADEPFAWAQSYAKNYVEQSQPIADPFKAFNERQSG